MAVRLPAAIILLAICGFGVTADRVPVVWKDETLYAAVARAVQQESSGAPSIATGPAVDHVAFYGPVYFTVAARAFDLLGVSPRTFRLIDLLGVLLVAAATARFAHAAGASPARQAWAAAAILLTPEAGSIATSGRMDALGIGEAMVGLACYAHALARPRYSLWLGGAAALALSAAALTDPRCYPLVAAAIAAGGLLAVTDRRGVSARWRLWLPTVAVTTGLVALWAMASVGSIGAWLSVRAHVATHEVLDVAIAPGASRVWSFSAWHVSTSMLAVTGLTLVLWRHRRTSTSMSPAGRFLLTAAVLNFVMSVAALNITFTFAAHFAVPLLAAVMAAAPLNLGGQRRIAVAFLAIALITGGAVRLAKYVRVAATWDARDPRPIDAFVAAHVPRGSVVAGPPDYYFYAVERAGSRYVVDEPLADWTRWFSPNATALRAPAEAEYLLWPEHVERPEPWNCAGARVVARFEPAADHGAWLGPIRKLPGTVPDTYPATLLVASPCR